MNAINKNMKYILQIILFATVLLQYGNNSNTIYSYNRVFKKPYLYEFGPKLLNRYASK